MNIPTYFARFLKEIRLTENQVNDLIKGHTTLRNRLEEDEDLSKIIVSTFLQGVIEGLPLFVQKETVDRMSM